MAEIRNPIVILFTGLTNQPLFYLKITSQPVYGLPSVFSQYRQSDCSS